MKATNSANEEKKNALGDWRYMLTMAILLPLSLSVANYGGPQNMNTAAFIGSCVPSFFICFLIWLWNKPKFNGENVPQETAEQLQDNKTLEKNKPFDPWEARDSGEI